MRGHVARKGKRYYPVVDVGRDPESGRRRQKWHASCSTKREAERALVTILGSLQTAAYVEPSRGTVADFLIEWLPAIRATVRPSTWASYETHVRRYLSPRLGPVSLQRVSAPAITTLYADLLAEGLSAGSVRRVAATLHRALEDAVRWGRVHRNAADQATPPRKRTPEMSVWTTEELGRFLTAVEDDRLYALWLLFATTGLRRGEALALRWPDVDLEARRIAVRQSVVPVNGRLIYAEPKTPRGRRSVALDVTTARALREHRKRQAEERLAVGPAYQAGDLLFCREDGAPLAPGRVSHRFAETSRRVGLPPIRLHDLRHTHATMALAAGVHPKTVSERLGHSSVSLTLDLYSHAIPALQEEAADRIAGLLFPSRALEVR
jgi:integrase